MGNGLSEKIDEKNNWNYFLFRDINSSEAKGRVLCQNMREPIKAKSGEKKWRARKSRKREDNDDSRKTIAPHRTPKRSSKKRPSQPIPNLI